MNFIKGLRNSNQYFIPTTRNDSTKLWVSVPTSPRDDFAYSIHTASHRQSQNRTQSQVADLVRVQNQSVPLEPEKQGSITTPRDVFSAPNPFNAQESVGFSDGTSRFFSKRASTSSQVTRAGTFRVNKRVQKKPIATYFSKSYDGGAKKSGVYLKSLAAIQARIQIYKQAQLNENNREKMMMS